MRLRHPINEQSLTGEVPQPMTSTAMYHRVNSIKNRTLGRSFNVKKSQADIHGQLQPVSHQINRTTIQPQNDTISTNFYPGRPSISSAAKRPIQQLNKRSQDNKITRPRSNSLQARKFKGLKTHNGRGGRTGDALIYEREIKYLKQLYQYLANVLCGIKTGFEDIQKSISEYGKFISNPKLQFIDDFMEYTDIKVKKTVRMSRIHEYLSIAYLFLQIAQGRMQNNQSYLINFIGFCLSNLIFVARIYILLERKPEYQDHSFEKEVQEFQVTSYGEALRNLDDVLLRMQHNNEIITMIHKKLGRDNEKFEECIKMFLKNAERKKYTTCLCSHYIFQYLSMHIHECQLVGISQFLQVAPTPYLAPPQHQYTLIFEPMGIMKHGNQMRSYLMQFIRWASKYFDLVMWTWEMPNQLEDLLSLIDPYLYAKLFRYHCIVKNEIYTKDLNRLGRNLQKTLIIDYDQRIYGNTPKNGIVCRWNGKKKQKGLLVVSQILEQMLSSESSVQEMLTFYAEELHSIRGF